MVQVIHRDRTWEIKSGSTVRDLVLKVGLNPEAVLALRDGKLVSEAAITQDGDVIKIVAVVSGG